MKRKTLSFISLFAGILLFVLLFAFPLPAVSASASYTDPETGKTIIDTNWWFEEISVEMDVRRDKTFAITETMRVGFIKGGVNTGIIRDIQRISNTTRVIDGKSEKGTTYLANLTNVSVTINGEPAKVTESLYDQGNFFSVKMQKQDESYFPATEQSNQDSYNVFVFSYEYDMSNDKAAGYDDFTFDVLGYAMDYTKRFTAQITFPEDLDEEAVSFRTNNKAEWVPDESKGESVSVEGNVITLFAVPMHENKGYTVQVLFEDGYFETHRTFFWFYIPIAAVSAVAMVAGLVIFLKYCVRKPVAQVEFYPPEGMGIMRYSAIWHGRARLKEIGAVITHWASQGLVRIEKDGRKDFTVYQLRDCPNGMEEAERKYFNELFKPMFTGFDEQPYFSTREMRNSTDRVRCSRLASKAEEMRAAGEEPSVLYPHITRAHILLTIMSLVPVLCTLIYGCILSASALPLLLFIFIAAGTAVGSAQAKNRMTPICYIFPLAFMGFPMFMFGFLFYFSLYDYAGLLFIAIGFWALVQVGLHFLLRRNPDVVRDLGKMRGFKQFLLTAELSRIERMFLDNPDYFSDIIPYCLVMGISKQVEKRFEPLHIAAPEWASGISASSFSSMSRALSHSSGGGSSGGGGGHGGSSGGGGGGGGSRGC